SGITRPIAWSGGAYDAQPFIRAGAIRRGSIRTLWRSEPMTRLHQRILYALAAFVLVPLLALASYDLFVFQPYRPDIDKLIARASSSEKKPPEPLRRVLRISYEDRLAWHVAKQLLLELDAASASGSKIGWHATNVLWWLLSQVHLSEAQRTTLFLSLFYMGNDQRGFERASPGIVGVPLAEVSVDQAATLVTVGKSPAAYLANRERLAQSAGRLAERANNGP
ncbi:MAG: transglycosylase domain-containing protein, partial [Paucibacter sp.]|nr:transglycosylase domain-containing protein [Roseateles sp.]